MRSVDKLGTLRSDIAARRKRNLELNHKLDDCQCEAEVALREVDDLKRQHADNAVATRKPHLSGTMRSLLKQQQQKLGEQIGQKRADLVRIRQKAKNVREERTANQRGLRQLVQEEKALRVMSDHEDPIGKRSDEPGRPRVQSHSLSEKEWVRLHEGRE